MILHLMGIVMFPYVLDRKYSINNNLLETEHNKTSQLIVFTIELGYCNVSVCVG